MAVWGAKAVSTAVDTVFGKAKKLDFPFIKNINLQDYLQVVVA